MRHKNPGKGSIYQTADGRWKAAFTLGYDGQGRQIRKVVSAKTEREVIARRNELLIDLQKGTLQRGKVTVETWMREWLATTAFHQVSPRVLSNYESINRRHITPALGKYRLVDVGPEEVRELHQAVRKSGVSDRTLQIIHGVFSRALHQAMLEGHVEGNPCERVDRPRARSRQREALTVAEARKVIAASKDDPLGSLWTAFLLTGARRGELLGLERDRVDLDSRELDLSWQVQEIPWAHGEGCGCEGTPAKCPEREHRLPPGYEHRPLYLSRMLVRPKTQSSTRVIPMASPLVGVLRRHLFDSPAAMSGLVWHDFGMPIRYRDVSAGWKAALSRAGARPIELHSTRHTTASLLLEAGVSPEVISQILGHSEVVTTRGYMHVNRRMAADAMDSLSGLLGLVV